MVALVWHRSNKKWSQDTADRLHTSMNNHIFLVICHLCVTGLKPRHFIDLQKEIEENGYYKSRFTQADFRNGIIMPPFRNLSTATRMPVLMV